MNDTTLSLVEFPTLPETAPKLLRLRDWHQRHTRQAWVGALVMTFSNDELRLLADHYLSVADVNDLQRLGLLNGNDRG